MGRKLCVIRKNKLKVYEVKTSLKFYKIKEEILKNNMIKVNGIYNFNVRDYDYYNDNEEVKCDGHYYLFLEKEILRVGEFGKIFYRGYRYPEIIDLALQLRDGDISSLEKLNCFRAPLYISKMRESKKKEKLLKEYPFDKYVDEIINCFSLKKIEEVTFNNMEDLVRKIEKVTKYNSTIDCGDSDVFRVAKRAEISMYIPDDYGNKNSGISKFKQMLEEHEKIYSILGGSN